MSNNKSTKSSPENSVQLAQQLFCTSDTYNSITKARQHSEQARIIFNDIFQLVNGNSQADFIARSPLIIKKINTDIRLRKIYLQLINQLKFAESQLQTAASSGELLPARISECFSLKFKRDKNHPTQVYVILTISHPAEHHLTNAVTIHITKDNLSDCLYFPKLIDGRSQLLMEEDSLSFKLITSDNSHLYLM